MNSFGNKTASAEARGLDCYETPLVAVKALADSEHLPPSIWEPCCGPGNIVKYLRDAGHTVSASDIKDYGCPDSFVADFLDEEVWPKNKFDAIVTNPPFRQGDAMIRRALRICPKVFIFQRLLFLEGQRRSDILDNNLRRVHVFKSRLPMMHRYGYSGKKSTSQVPYAWYVFERGYTGPVTIDRIDHHREKKSAKQGLQPDQDNSPSVA